MADNVTQEVNIEDENIEEDFSNAFGNEDDTESLHVIDENKEDLKTHDKIRTNLCGTIIKLDKGYSKTTLLTTKEMILDDLGLIHSGFIFGAADYAAAVAVNEENVIIIGSRSKFLAPAKIDDLIEFEATAKFEDSRKREIKVSAYINEIKVYDGLFQAVVLEQHIFKTKIKGASRSYN
jgi:acyl-coenzyme A thioesterase PaaI-like protein